MSGQAHIEVRGLTMAYGGVNVLENVSFTVERGSIFFIIGGSGSGKSTLLRTLIGLLQPVAGEIDYDGQPFLALPVGEREQVLRRFGVLFQSGGLFTSMTLAENVALPLEQFTRLRRREVSEMVGLKLSLVGLGGFGSFYPEQLSGGMQRRAGVARAIALDPQILFFDEPSSGLDPVVAHRLDGLIAKLRESFGATVVIVSHEVRSILEIGDRCIFLDGEARGVVAAGSPRELCRHPPNQKVAEFFGVEQPS